MKTIRKYIVLVLTTLVLVGAPLVHNTFNAVSPLQAPIHTAEWPGTCC